MKARHIALASALLAIALPASAAFTLDFEGVGDLAAINAFYNGGTDSAGHTGTNYGIQFGSNALGVIDKDVGGGTGNFANEPSASTTMSFVEGRAVLNSAPGFTGGFSFLYSSTVMPVVNVYDGLNATGNVIGSLTLNNQATGNGCQGGPNGAEFCNWTLASATFSSLAKSIDFGGTENQIGFDNMKFGVDTPSGSPVIPDVPPITPPGGVSLRRQRARA
jgi:hypothetical protein